VLDWELALEAIVSSEWLLEDSECMLLLVDSDPDKADAECAPWEKMDEATDANQFKAPNLGLEVSIFVAALLSKSVGNG
jgi:hypothetical protein